MPPDAPSPDPSALGDALLDACSHDLRAPVAAIMTFAQVLRDGTCGPLNDQQAETVRAIEARARSLSRMIDDLVDLARFRSGRIDAEPAPCRLGALCADVRALARAPAVRKGIDLAAGAPADLEARLDMRRAKQILFLLAEHAIAAAPVGGTVRITARRDADGAVLEVTGDLDPQAPAESTGLLLARRFAEGLGGACTAHEEPGPRRTHAVRVPQAFS